VLILDGVIFTDFLHGKVYHISPMISRRLRQRRRRSTPARDEDGALGRSRELVLRTFPLPYAFLTKFHGNSIAQFRGLWLAIKCQNRLTCFDVRVLDMPLLDATMACSPCSSPTQRYRIREISVRTAARLCGMSPIRPSGGRAGQRVDKTPNQFTRAPFP
jgi:hypothetical protein